LEDRIGTVVVAVDRIGTKLFFFPRVELVLDAKTLDMVEVVHQGVSVSLLGLKIVWCKYYLFAFVKYKIFNNIYCGWYVSLLDGIVIVVGSYQHPLRALVEIPFSSIG
jgi:hypothetical protein